MVEEFGSTTVVFPGQRLEVDVHGILIVRPARGTPEAVRMKMRATVQPWPVAPKLPDARSTRSCCRSSRMLNSIEAEIEYAIERTARSPMIVKRTTIASACSTVTAAS